MTKTMVVELPSGKKLLFGGPEKGGLHEVSLNDQLATKASGQFETALGTLGELVGVLEKTVGGVVHRPSKVEMEFGATLSADCNLWIVSGKGEAEFKVTLSWDADGKTGT
jgi:hypothetical protein